MNDYPNQTNPAIPAPLTDSSSIESLEEQEKRIRHFHLFSISSIIYALFYTFCLYKNASGITYPFFVSGTLFYFFSSLKKLGISAKKDSAFYVISIMLLGISIFCTDNDYVILMNKFGIFMLSFLLFIHNFYTDTLWDFSKYIFALLQTVFGSFQSIGRPISDFRLYIGKNKGKEKKEVSYAAYIFIGILISIPLIIVILLLLSSADIVFYSFIKDFISLYWLQNNFMGLCFSVLFSFFASYSILACLEKKSIKEQVPDKRTGEPLIAITVTSILSVIYLLFSGIQIVYLFIGNMQLPENYIPASYTYADYAREGFFQLLFVCLINLALVLICLGRFKENKVLKILLTIVSLCTYIMIASSTMRMFMYIKHYDLTFLRIFVLWALAVIFLLMTGVIFKIYKTAFPLFKYCIVTVTIFYIGFSFSRPDYFIAKYNISQMLTDKDYEDKSSISIYGYDTKYLSRLSADAAPAILNAQTLAALIGEPQHSYTPQLEWEQWMKKYGIDYFPFPCLTNTWMEEYRVNLSIHFERIEMNASKARTFNLSRYTAKKCISLFTLSQFITGKCSLFYLPY